VTYTGAVLYDAYVIFKYNCMFMPYSPWAAAGDSGDSALDALHAKGFIGTLDAPWQTFNQYSALGPAHAGWFPASNYVKENGGSGYPIFWGTPTQGTIWDSQIEDCAFDASLTTYVVLQVSDQASGGILALLYGGAGKFVYVLCMIILGIVCVLSIPSLIYALKEKQVVWSMISLTMFYSGVTGIVRCAHHPIGQIDARLRYFLGPSAMFPANLAIALSLLLPLFASIISSAMCQGSMAKLFRNVVNMGVTFTVLYLVIFPYLLLAGWDQGWLVTGHNDRQPVLDGFGTPTGDYAAGYIIDPATNKSQATTILAHHMEFQKYVIHTLLAMGIALIFFQILSIFVILKASKMSSNREKLISLIKWTFSLAGLAIASFLIQYLSDYNFYDENVCDYATQSTENVLGTVAAAAQFTTGFPASIIAVSAYDKCSAEGQVYAELANAFGGELVNAFFFLILSVFTFFSTKRTSSSSSSSSSS